MPIVLVHYILETFFPLVSQTQPCNAPLPTRATLINSFSSRTSSYMRGSSVTGKTSSRHIPRGSGRCPSTILGEVSTTSFPTSHHLFPTTVRLLRHRSGVLKLFGLLDWRVTSILALEYPRSLLPQLILDLCPRVLPTPPESLVLTSEDYRQQDKLTLVLVFSTPFSAILPNLISQVPQPRPLIATRSTYRPPSFLPLSIMLNSSSFQPRLVIFPSITP